MNFTLIHIFPTVFQGFEVRWLPSPRASIQLAKKWLTRSNVVSMKWFLYGTLFLHISTSQGCFGARTIITKKQIAQVTSDLFHIRDLQTIIKIISRGVAGVATDYPCSVWGRGWTTCLLYDGPLLGLGFICQLVWKFIWWKWVVLLISCLYLCFMRYPTFAYYFPLKLFYSQIAFMYFLRF